MHFNCYCLIKAQLHHLPTPPSLLNLLPPLLYSLFHTHKNKHINNTSGVHSGLPACIFLGLRSLNWIFLKKKIRILLPGEDEISFSQRYLIAWSSSSWEGALEISSIYSEISISAGIILVLFRLRRCWDFMGVWFLCSI